MRSRPKKRAASVVSKGASPLNGHTAGSKSRHRRRSRPRQDELGSLHENRTLELLQLDARLEPELLAKERTCVAIDAEAFDLPPGAVERQHELRAEPLAVRMLGAERLELGHELALPPEGELGLDPVLDGCEAKLLEPLDVDARERLELEVGERSPLPERLGSAQLSRREDRVPCCERLTTAREQALELLEVELARLDAQQVARRPGGDARRVVVQRLAEPRDVVAEGVVGRVHALVGEELRDQSLTGDNAVRTQKQQGEEGPLLRASDRYRRAVHLDDERPENPELEARVGHRAPTSLLLPAATDKAP